MHAGHLGSEGGDQLDHVRFYGRNLLEGLAGEHQRVAVGALDLRRQSVVVVQSNGAEVQPRIELRQLFGALPARGRELSGHIARVPWPALAPKLQQVEAPATAHLHHQGRVRSHAVLERLAGDALARLPGDTKGKNPVLAAEHALPLLPPREVALAPDHIEENTTQVLFSASFSLADLLENGGPLLGPVLPLHPGLISFHVAHICPGKSLVERAQVGAPSTS